MRNKIISKLLVLTIGILILAPTNSSQAAPENILITQSFSQQTSRTLCLNLLKKQVLLSIQESNPSQKMIDTPREKTINSMSEAECKRYSFALAHGSSLKQAIIDATLIGQSFSASLSDYTSLGTSSGSISFFNTAKGSNFQEGVLRFSKMANATGAGAYSPDGPGLTKSKIKISANSRITSGSYRSNVNSADPYLVCVVITNNFTYAKVTTAGIVSSQIGGKPLTCSNGA